MNVHAIMSDDCPICLDSIDLEDDASPECGHSIHIECAKQMHSVLCPLCRAPLVSKNISQADFCAMEDRGRPPPEYRVVIAWDSDTTSDVDDIPNVTVPTVVNVTPQIAADLVIITDAVSNMMGNLIRSDDQWDPTPHDEVVRVLSEVVRETIVGIQSSADARSFFASLSTLIVARFPNVETSVIFDLVDRSLRGI